MRRSGREMSNLTPEAVVCIPTFRRPAGLKKTLESLATQAGANNFAVVGGPWPGMTCSGFNAFIVFPAARMSEMLTNGRKILICSDTNADAENSTRSCGSQIAVSASL